jgi:hypothetical protein
MKEHEDEAKLPGASFPPFDQPLNHHLKHSLDDRLANHPQVLAIRRLTSAGLR